MNPYRFFLVRSVPPAGVVLIAGLLGYSISEKPAVALLSVLGVLLALTLAATAEHRLLPTFVLCLITLAGTVDLLRRIPVGQNTAYAWITVLATVVAAILVLRSAGSLPQNSIASSWTLIGSTLLFPLWTTLSLPFFGISQDGIQNVLVYWLFSLVLLLTVAASISNSLSFDEVRITLRWAYLGAALLYAGSVILEGVGGEAIIGRRSYALFAMTGVAWSASLVRFGYRSELVVIFASLPMILLSLSRTAFIISLLTCVLALGSIRNRREFLRTLGAICAVAILTYVAFVEFSSFSDRFTTGDVQMVLGTSTRINVSGRRDLWSATLDSALTSPIIGQGAGSSESTIGRTIVPDSHPHNDYLRLFHDFGIVGLVLFLLFLISIFFGSLKRGSVFHDPRIGAARRAAATSLVALLLSMITDNPLVYGFVVVPVAIFFGLAIGLQVRSSRMSEIDRSRYG